MRIKPPTWDTARYPHEPEGMSVGEVALRLGCTEQDVRNVENRALAKIRRMLDVPDPNPPRMGGTA